MKGSIQKRGNKYYVIVYQGLNDKGKPRQRWYSGFTTFEEANEFLVMLQPQLLSHKSLAAFMKFFLDMKKSRVRPGTFRSYEWLAEKHIIPQLGKLKLHQITPLDIQMFYNKLLNQKNISSQSVLHIHRLLNQVLKTAYRYRLAKENVCELVDAPRAFRPEVKFWNAETLSEFLLCSRHSRFYTAYVLLAFTGMRLGEMAGLKWADIDFANGIARIRRSWSYTGKGYRFEEPKTASGKRPIALSDFVLGCCL